MTIFKKTDSVGIKVKETENIHLQNKEMLYWESAGSKTFILGLFFGWKPVKGVTPACVCWLSKQKQCSRCNG